MRSTYGNDARLGNDKDILLGSHGGEGRFVVQGDTTSHQPTFFSAATCPTSLNSAAETTSSLPASQLTQPIAMGLVDPCQGRYRRISKDLQSLTKWHAPAPAWVRLNTYLFRTALSYKINLAGRLLQQEQPHQTHKDKPWSAHRIPPPHPAKVSADLFLLSFALLYALSREPTVCWRSTGPAQSKPRKTLAQKNPLHLPPLIANLRARVPRTTPPRSHSRPLDICFRRFTSLNTTIRLREGRPVRLSDLLEPALEAVHHAIAHIHSRQALQEAHRTHPRADRYRRYVSSEAISETSRSTSVRLVAANASLRRPGHYYDLDEVFESLNTRFFHGLPGSYTNLVRSSRSPHAGPLRRSAQHHRRQPSLRLPRQSPRCAIEYLVYHEKLHLKHPVSRQPAAAVFTHASFRPKRLLPQNSLPQSVLLSNCKTFTVAILHRRSEFVPVSPHRATVIPLRPKPRA